VATPPFEILQGKPALTDIVSQHPADERAMRDVVESSLAIEHDMGDASATKGGRHKFGVGADAARDAITTWVVGSIWLNTKTTPVTVQRVVSIAPVVWEDLSGGALDLFGQTASSPNFSNFFRALSLFQGSLPVLNKVAVQVFTTGSGTYTPTSGMKFAIGICVGAGGGSGGVGTTNGVASAGAGGGATSWKLLTAASVGASQAYTVGASGAAGASTPTDGGDGGDTSIGALCVAKGGTHSIAQTTIVFTTGALGGLASSGTGDFRVSGGTGGGSGNIASTSGPVGGGGDSSFGAGAPSSVTNVNLAGIAGRDFGGGASGAFRNGANQAGALGGEGGIFIIEFLSTI
jgi:hypothetical protein